MQQTRFSIQPGTRPVRDFLARQTHRGRRASLALSLLLLLQATIPRIVSGQERSVDEYKLKAAILYNLTQFVEWPASADAGRQGAILVCILGRDPFGDNLTSTVSEATKIGRPVLIRRLPDEKEVRSCHVLYISSSERKSTPHILSVLNGSGVLTVGEMTQFAAHGGMIQMSLENRNVRFDINLEAASQAGLKISSKLLALAQIVKRS